MAVGEFHRYFYCFESKDEDFEWKCQKIAKNKMIKNLKFTIKF